MQLHNNHSLALVKDKKTLSSVRLAKKKSTEKEIKKQLNNDTRLDMTKKATYGATKSTIKQ